MRTRGLRKLLHGVQRAAQTPRAGAAFAASESQLPRALGRTTREWHRACQGDPGHQQRKCDDGSPFRDPQRAERAFSIRRDAGRAHGRGGSDGRGPRPRSARPLGLDGQPAGQGRGPLARGPAAARAGRGDPDRQPLRALLRQSRQHGRVRQPGGEGRRLGAGAPHQRRPARRLRLPDRRRRGVRGHRSPWTGSRGA